MKERSLTFLNVHGFMGEADNKNSKALAVLYPDATLLSPQIDGFWNSGFIGNIMKAVIVNVVKQFRAPLKIPPVLQ